MEHIKIIEEKIERLKADLKIIVKMSKSVDKIKNSKIKYLFEDLVTENIMSIGRNITDFEKYIKEEKEKLNDTIRGKNES